MAEFSNSPQGGGWIHCVSFSGDGNKLAWVGHDSSISVVDATKEMSIYKLKTKYLPFLNCVWVSPSALVTAGHGCVPFLFDLESNGQIVFRGKLEKEEVAEDNTKFNARKMFEGMADRGQKSSPRDTVLNTTHQNQIGSLRIQSGDKFGVSKVSSSGNDGKIVIWDVKTIEK